MLEDNFTILVYIGNNEVGFCLSTFQTYHTVLHCDLHLSALHHCHSVAWPLLLWLSKQRFRHIRCVLSQQFVTCCVYRPEM